MGKADRSGINRREFLQHAAIAGAAAAGALSGCASNPIASGKKYTGVSIYLDQANAVSSSRPTQWATEELRNALVAKNVPTRICTTAGQIDPAHLKIFVRQDKIEKPESLYIGMLRSNHVENEVYGLQAIGADARGTMYAMLELKEIALHSSDPISALANSLEVEKQPSNTVRSVMRMFCTDVEDTQWYNDRGFWKEYLTMLASQRFNRFHLAFGLGYDAPSGLTDTYFYFAYPFLLSVPGYDVRASNLSNAERDRNLEMLRFISDETAARGMDFQLGIWTHAHKWTNSPRAHHNIEGLTDDALPAYSRDAIALLLKECPSISGVTFRIHGESGVAEGNYDFWKTVFDGCTKVDRRIEIDMHAKGMDQKMIDTALSVGRPLTISPKYWAEHMGLPYHQAAIRQTEQPTRERGSGLLALSTGSRSFTRYGYGDLLDENRKFGIIHRMWPGTQRVLMWGDPTFAAAYSRSSSFCGSLGCELMEPLSFKGRKGSGVPGGRDSYADTSLRAPGGDFTKYDYYYRLWGRLLYNPDANPQSWQRYLGKEYGHQSAGPVEKALASSSRILPLFTTAHTPAAANNNYWPEMYVNMSIIDGARRTPYTETPVPSRFGTVSPLDPQLFSKIDDEVQALLDKKPLDKYSQAEVAQWLETLATDATKHLIEAHSSLNGAPETPAFRRMAIDVKVASALGRFFAHKIRAAGLFAIYEKAGRSRTALQAGIATYRAARDAWMQVIEQTRLVYSNDVSYGSDWFQRGHWADRLPAIETDIAAMEALLPNAAVGTIGSDDLIAAVLHPLDRPKFDVSHQPSGKFTPNQPLPVVLEVHADNIADVQCYYRRTHQAEAWNMVAMESAGGVWRNTIPRPVVDSSFPVQYYFRLTDHTGNVALYPGFNATLSNQPYFVARPS